MKAGRHLTSEDISAFLDGELELDGAGKAHLASCPRCSGALEERRKLRRLARAANPEVPTERMWKAIREGIKREPAPRPGFFTFLFHRPRWIVAGSAGTVAAALLAVVAVRQVIENRPKPMALLVETAPAGRVAGGGAEIAPRREGEPAKDSAENKAAVPAEMERAEPEAGPGKMAAFDEAAERSAPSAPSTAGRAPTTPAAPAAAPTLQAAEGAQAPARSAKKAVARATEAASRADQARPSFEGARFILSADSLDTPAGGVVRAAGRVSVRPARPGLSYVALVDGLSRTLTGVQEAASAEIHRKGELLILKTKE